MRRLIRQVGLAGVVGLLCAATAAADSFSLGFSFGNGRGGTAVNVGVGWSDPSAVVVTRPVQATRVWVPPVQYAYREVPVLDACGRVIAYRREPYTVQTGHWVTVTQPAPVAVGCHVSRGPDCRPGGCDLDWRHTDGLRRYPAPRARAR